jgi:Protein O-mannosyl-transferase TMEM260-like
VTAGRDRTAVTTAAARWLPSVLVGFVAFAAARAALLPDVGFWDTAELQAVAPLMGTAHPTGYPTYVLLGWLANLALTPFGEPALRMNLFAALSLGVAAAVTADLARALTRSAALGILAGLGLALTDVAWSIGTHADVHALHLALVAILFRCLVAWEDRVAATGIGHGDGDRFLVGSAVVFGLAVGNHSLTLLLAPAIAMYVLAVDPRILRRPRLIATCAGALAITTVLVFLELPLRAAPFRAPMVYGRPETWDGFWYIVLAEQFRESVAGPLVDLPTKVADVVHRAAVAFGPLAALIPVGFAATAILRPTYALLSGVSVLLTCAFAASYDNAEIERYYLGPAFIAWTWLAILAGGVATALSRTVDAEDEAVGQPVRGSWSGPDRVIALGISASLLLPTAFALPNRFARVDRGADFEAREWVDRALATMRPNGVIVSWWSYSTPLWYAQHIEGQRPDLTVIDDRTRLDLGLGDVTDVIDVNLPNRPVYLIRVDPAEIAALERRYVLEYMDGTDARSLTRVVSRRQASE